MKTINLLAVIITAVLLSISLNSNSFSSQNDMDCKCCGQDCIDAKCCTMDKGESQGAASGCCTEACPNEECKKCCASGTCTMMKDTKDPSHGQGNMNNENMNANDKSCCSDKSNTESKTKDCCK